MSGNQQKFTLMVLYFYIFLVFYQENMNIKCLTKAAFKIKRDYSHVYKIMIFSSTIDIVLLNWDQSIYWTIAIY